MSAAATAAGYLYASGRLRGRGARDQEHAPQEEAKAKPESAPKDKAKLRKPVRVAVLPNEEAAGPGERPKRTPRIEYRVRRWRPGQEPGE